MKLDPNLAQSIVDRMMEIIPYNINMMNEKGIIIASGDKKRINTLHVGAIDSIQSGKTQPMLSSFGKYGQPGVNIPVRFDDQIIGVIGITGEPNTVTPLAALLKISTELLISQIHNAKLESRRKENLNYFLYEWTNTPDASQNDELRLHAQSLNIDLTVKRYVAVIEAHDLNDFNVKSLDFSFRKSPDQYLLIVRNETNLEHYLDYCIHHHLTIGISDKNIDLKLATQQAQDTIRLSKELQLSDVHYFKEVHFLNAILDSTLASDWIIDIFKSFLKTKSGLELLETLDAYFRHNGNVTETSKALNIHRNTTNYRLNRISEYFTLDLKNLNDAFELYVNYLYFKKFQYDQTLV